MTDSKERHTPGPWKAVEAPYNPAGWLWVQNGPGALLADVHQNPNIPLDARNANARLMAAAPELLAALRAIAEFDVLPSLTEEELRRRAVADDRISSRNDKARVAMRGASPYRDNAHALRTAIENARAAIAKAMEND